MQPHFIRRLSAVASLVLFAQAAFGQTAPTLIPFQGRLTNQLGVPYENGQYTLTFNLYSQAVGGSTVWTERHEKVGVVNGMVNVFLGSINSFPQWLPGSNPPVSPFAGTKYLGITVDADANPATADPEMVPRTMLVPAFFAQNSGQLAGFDWSSILQGGTNNPQTGTIRADKLTPASITSAQIAPSSVATDRLADGAVTTDKLADNSISSSDLAAAVREALIPPGTILPYGGTTAPSGFLMCAGQLFPKTTYPALSSVLNNAFGGDSTNFRVPDLRGQFLRGTDDPDGPGTQFAAAGRDPNVSAADRPAMAIGGNSGNNIGSVQGDVFQQHRHMTVVPDVNNTGQPLASAEWAIANRAAARVYTDRDDYYLYGNTNDPSVGKTSTVGGSETRPKNAYVNYIIKY